MYRTHGHAAGRRTGEYKSWRAMLARCNNPNDPAFDRYGGRGIKVCSAWSSFENFLSDMGERPEGMTLDREDNDGDYTPSNCRWSTPCGQGANKRNNHLITAAGETKTISNWARDLGVDAKAIRHRIEVMGWTPEQAVTTPKRSKPVEVMYA